MSRWRRRLVMTGVLLCLFLGVAYFFSSLLLPASRRSRVERVEIPARSTASQIADLLAEKGVIRSRLVFTWTARVLGEAKNMKAGEYQLDASDNLFQIIDKIASGQAIAPLVTIPEGYTTAQIERLLLEARLIDFRDFQRECSEPARYLNVGIPRASLEGYLLPDSYKFKKGATAGAIVRMITANFRRRVLDEMQWSVRASGKSLDEIIIIASLIEREARAPDDRERISAVIHNRLRRKMRLQIDATVLYALGGHRPQVTFKDLRIDSPYNTYRHAGLPPGPICNPGVACIQAALRPARVNYLYYVAQMDGRHYFSTTYEEHKRHGGT